MKAVINSTACVVQISAGQESKTNHQSLVVRPKIYKANDRDGDGGRQRPLGRGWEETRKSSYKYGYKEEHLRWKVLVRIEKIGFQDEQKNRAGECFSLHHKSYYLVNCGKNW